MRDKFIRELSEQPQQNSGIIDTKINIHFPLRGDIVKYCIDINSNIAKIAKNHIDFSPKSFHIPHITLYMGFITNQHDYDNILNEIYSISLEMEPLRIYPTNVYLKGPNRNYIFFDTEQSNQIIHIKEIIKNRTLKWIKPLSWDVVNETPHVTVGYIKNNFSEIDDLLENYPVGPDWVADSIEVSYCGPWGSCLGTIRTFEFPE